MKLFLIRFIETIILMVIGYFLLLFLGFLPRGNPEGGRRSYCRYRLKQIGVALHNYHDEYKAFPPAYTVDSQGMPLHSWRTLILPYLDSNDKDLKALYESIDLSKPWDDPVNDKARQSMPFVFECPSALHVGIKGLENKTVYLAVVTPRSCLQPVQSHSFRDLVDGTTNTILVFEVSPTQAVEWMKPKDADLGMVLKNFGPDIKRSHARGAHALFGDGTTKFVRDNIPLDTLRSLISFNGGENISATDY